MTLLIDANLSPRVADALRAAGVGAVHVRRPMFSAQRASRLDVMTGADGRALNHGPADGPRRLTTSG